jgi:hypothetical protein
MRVGSTDFSLGCTIWLVVLPVTKIDGSSPSVKKKVTVFNYFLRISYIGGDLKKTDPLNDF